MASVYSHLLFWKCILATKVGALWELMAGTHCHISQSTWVMSAVTCGLGVDSDGNGSCAVGAWSSLLALCVCGRCALSSVFALTSLEPHDSPMGSLISILVLQVGKQRLCDVRDYPSSTATILWTEMEGKLLAYHWHGSVCLRTANTSDPQALYWLPPIIQTRTLDSRGLFHIHSGCFPIHRHPQEWEEGAFASFAQEWTAERSGQEAGETREVFTPLKAADQLAALHKHEGTSASLSKTHTWEKQWQRRYWKEWGFSGHVCRPFF